MKPFNQQISYPPSVWSFSHFNLKGQKQQQDKEEESKKAKQPSLRLQTAHLPLALALGQ